MFGIMLSDKKSKCSVRLSLLETITLGSPGMPQARGDRRGAGGGALGPVVLVSLVVVTLLCTVALVVALSVVGSGLSGRMDEADRRVGVLLQRITDLEAENDYLFEDREGKEIAVCVIPECRSF